MKKNRRKILSGSRKIFFAILAMFLSLSASAQQITASGQVLDAQKEPLIGVSVQEKGTSNGAITDLDGNFTLNVKQNAILIFSYVINGSFVVLSNTVPDTVILLLCVACTFAVLPVCATPCKGIPARRVQETATRQIFLFICIIFLFDFLCVINQSYSSAFLPKSGPTQLAFSVALPCTQSS